MNNLSVFINADISSFQVLMSGSQDLVINPEKVVKDIFDFAELRSDQDTINYICNTVDNSKSKQWHNYIDEKILLEIRDYLEPTLNLLGYDW